jgi:hypothetical protein
MYLLDEQIGLHETRVRSDDAYAGVLIGTCRSNTIYMQVQVNQNGVITFAKMQLQSKLRFGTSRTAQVMSSEVPGRVISFFNTPSGGLTWRGRRDAEKKRIHVSQSCKGRTDGDRVC